MRPCPKTRRIKKVKIKSSKQTRKELTKKIDIAFSIYIRKRDKRCVICGTAENLTCGHLITLCRTATRWNVNNAFGQCRTCNYKHEFYPEIFFTWYVNHFGVDALNDLVRMSNTPKKYTIDELRDLLAIFKE